MKLMETTTKKIGEYEFYIRPFPAFVSANMSGEIAALVLPVIGALTPLASGADVGDVDLSVLKDGKMPEIDISKIDLADAGPVFGNAVSSLTGDKIESLMRKLLINHKNIAVSGPETNDEVKQLDYDLVNAIFCAEIQDLYALCWEVIKLNFGGFFKKLGSRFGNQQSALRATNTSDSES